VENQPSLQKSKKLTAYNSELPRSESLILSIGIYL